MTGAMTPSVGDEATALTSGLNGPQHSEYAPCMFGELGTPVELAQLMLDPVYYGVGVPRGRGQPVLVIPGFMGSDLYLMPLLGWLLRIGYRPFESTLVRNVGCPNELGNRLITRTERI